MVGHLKSVAGAQNSIKDAGAGGGGGPVGAATFKNPGTYSWTVPDGVTEVAIVCIGAGSGYLYSNDVLAPGVSSSVARGGSVLCRGIGGNSGDSPVRDGGGDQYQGAPGGYSDDGNSGAGGAAACASYKSSGGVGLWGEGPSGGAYTHQGGSGGQASLDDGRADSKFGGLFGGAAYGKPDNTYHGGGLSYKNNVSVTPGETLTVVVGAGGNSNRNSGYRGGDGGVNIVWGRGSFPSLDGVTVYRHGPEIGSPT